MAEKLIKYLQYVENEYGLEAKMKVAQKSNMPSSKASLEADTEENVDRLRTAITEVTGETPPEVE